jgi:hypothetical protein
VSEHAKYILTTPAGIRHGVERTDGCCSCSAPELGFASRPWTEVLIEIGRRKWSMKEHVGPWPIDVLGTGRRA